MHFKRHQKNISNAREAHEHWLRRAKHLIEGLPVSEEMIPLDPSSCEFGRWYYSIKLKLQKFPQFEELLAHIEEYHTKLHETYLDIYKIYFIELKRSWLMSKIIDSPPEPSSEQKKRAYRYFDEMEEISEQLMKEFDSFEMSSRLLKEEELKVLF